MKVVWSDNARQEWAVQYRFYFSRNKIAARRLREMVMNSARNLSYHPRIGRLGQVENTRELVVTGTPFLLVYDENPAQVEILHIYDARQNWQQDPDGNEDDAS